MSRIVNISMPGHINLFSALLRVRGIGPTKAKELCAALNIPCTTRFKELTPEQLSAINDYVSQNFIVEEELNRKIVEEIKRLKSIGCRRGVRLSRGLPNKGQRTHTNAKSARKSRYKSI